MSCDYGGEIKSIEAVDDSTVKFTLCAPDVAFPSKAAFSAFAIHSAAQLKATAGTSALLDNPIGTGPYMLDKWNKGDSIIMKANPNYWGEKPKSDQLVFRWSKEGAQRLLELQAGTVDGIDNPGPDDFAKIEADTALKLYPREALNIFYLGMSNLVTPFDNEKVRQAIAMGIDRQRIVDNFYPKGSTVADYFTPCAIPGGCEGDAWYKFDPAAAKKLLAEAGFPNGFETTLNYRDVVRGYLPQPSLVAQDIQAQLKENLGINVKIDVMESGAFLDAEQDRRSAAVPAGLGRRLPRPDQLPGLPLREGRQQGVRHRLHRHPRHAGQGSPTGRPGRAQQALRRGQRPGQAARADGPGGARRFRDGLQGRRHRRAQQPAEQRELLGDGRPATASSSSGCRTPSRSASTARMKKTASRCARASR